MCLPPTPDAVPAHKNDDAAVTSVACHDRRITGVQSLLYQVEPLDPVTFVAVPLLLLAVTLVAMALPARAATRISPTEAIRVE